MAQPLDSTADGNNLLALPDEIINNIFSFLAPEENLSNVQRVSKRISHLANRPLLWRHYCLFHFSYWHPKHDIKNRAARPIDETDWKELYRVRTTCNRKIAAHFETVVAGDLQRYALIRDIARLGYDAKDFLLEQCRADPLSGDGLSRRYHSNLILGSIHRDMAITEWLFIARGRVPLDHPAPPRRLERAVGALDLFVLHDQTGDLDQISSMLDQVAIQFRDAHPNHGQMTTREKALTLLRWLRSLNLVGLQDKDKMHQLRNCLLGQALRDDEHGSNWAITSIIFCTVARRVGLSVQFYEVPTQLPVIVRPPAGLTLDGWPVDPEQQGTSQSRLILLPFVRDDAVSEGFLRDMLRQPSRPLNPLYSAHVAFIAAMQLNSAATRISNSLGFQDRGTQARLLCGNDNVNLKACQYAAVWAELTMMNHKTDVWRQSLSRLIDRMMIFWPEDTWLVEKHLSTLHQEVDPHESALILQRFKSFIEGTLPPRPQAFSEPGVRSFFTIDVDNYHTHIPFRMGQVFRHKRLPWYGLITGWFDLDVVTESEYDKDGALVYRALRPRLNPTLSDRFLFRCLSSATSANCVIRAENMELVTDSSLITADMFPTAGSFFLRFNKDTCSFVSNERILSMELYLPNRP